MCQGLHAIRNAAFLMAAIWVNPATSGTITDLGSLGGSGYSMANAINDAGQIVGVSLTSNGDHAFLYSGGVMTDLGTFGVASGDPPPLVGNSSATGINNAGQVVGNTEITEPRLNVYGPAFLYSGGTGSLISSLSSAAAINSSGQIAGSVNFEMTVPFSNEPVGFGQAYVFSNGLLTALGGNNQGCTTDGYVTPCNSAATAINDAGQVVGDVEIPGTGLSGVNQAVLYSGDTVTDLIQPGSSISSSDATAINDNGQIVGYFDGPAGNTPFLYSAGVVTNLGMLPGFVCSPGCGTYAMGINMSGEVVGYAENGLTYQQAAFLYSNGVMIKLNSLLPAGSGWTLKAATAINDSGQIVGYGINPEGQTDAFLLNTSSSPEPASLALFGVAAALLLIRHYRLRSV
jgi:probable HAF family extracellular repeat protein